MGNQLFQYAFIIAAAKKVESDFYIDEFIEHSAVDKYFKNIHGKSSQIICKLLKIKGFKNIFSFHLRRYYYKNLVRLNRLSFAPYDSEKTASQHQLQNNTLYQGYFQSESFFYPFEDIIRKRFVLRDGYVSEFNSKYKGLYEKNKVVTVHIRRTDYRHLGHLGLGGDDLSVPLEYYKKAISKFDGQKVHFVFISDDADFVNQHFEEVDNKTVSKESEIIDFQHLLNADSCIISNSTFSWWGAWLNPKLHKIIYAPQYFMGWRIRKEIPQKIYPEKWIQIDFL